MEKVINSTVPSNLLDMTHSYSFLPESYFLYQGRTTCLLITQSSINIYAPKKTRAFDYFHPKNTLFMCKTIQILRKNFAYENWPFNPLLSRRVWMYLISGILIGKCDKRWSIIGSLHRNILLWWRSPGWWLVSTLIHSWLISIRIYPKMKSFLFTVLTHSLCQLLSNFGFFLSFNGFID